MWELVEVLPPDFADISLHAQLGIRPMATKEDVKAAYKKMVFKLRRDKKKEQLGEGNIAVQAVEHSI